MTFLVGVLVVLDEPTKKLVLVGKRQKSNKLWIVGKAASLQIKTYKNV
jgi:hypothetical protein